MLINKKPLGSVPKIANDVGTRRCSIRKTPKFQSESISSFKKIELRAVRLAKYSGGWREVRGASVLEQWAYRIKNAGEHTTSNEGRLLIASFAAEDGNAVFFGAADGFFSVDNNRFSCFDRDRFSASQRHFFDRLRANRW